MDIRNALTKPGSAQRFAAAVIDAYLAPAFGARSKSEIDLIVFTALIEAKAPGDAIIRGWYEATATSNLGTCPPPGRCSPLPDRPF